MHSLLIIGLILSSDSIFAATAPVPIHNHALLNSPLFNTPLAAPPSAVSNIFHRSVRLPGRAVPHLLSTTTVSTLFEAPQIASNPTATFPYDLDTKARLPPTWFARVGDILTPSTNTTLLTRTVTTFIPAVAGTVTVTALPATPSSTANGPRYQSITILETVPFTTTALPAVTVTGLQVLTSVVVVPVPSVESGVGATATTCNYYYQCSSGVVSS